MATTRESFEDAVRWVLRLLRIGLRRALTIGALVAAFAVAVVLTTRETVSDCGDVTDRQRTLMAVLADTGETASFRATGPARCVEGEFTAPVEGLASTMETATSQLTADGWVLEADYIAFYQQLWRRCFRSTEPGWERIQITVDATRGGAVQGVRATAPENVDACDLERRETSTIFPPSDAMPDPGRGA